MISFEFTQMLIRLFICVLVNFIIIHFLYYPKSRRRDFYFTYMLTSIAVFFLPRSVEQAEARGDKDGLGRDADPIGQHHGITIRQAVDGMDFRLQEDVRIGNLLTEPPHQVLGGRKVRKKPVPAGDMAPEMVLLLHDHRIITQQEQFPGRLHAGDAAADDDYIFFHRIRSI